MNNLFAELKRRNIFRVAGIYVVVGWEGTPMMEVAGSIIGGLLKRGEGSYSMAEVLGAKVENAP